MNEKELAIEVAKNLLKIKAVFLKPNDPFTWASGIKSPIYCDNRLTLSFPDVRKVVENGLAETIKKYYPDVDCCFSCQELDGDMVHDVTFEIVGGELTQKEYHYTDEEIEEYWRD